MILPVFDSCGTHEEALVFTRFGTVLLYSRIHILPFWKGSTCLTEVTRISSLFILLHCKLLYMWFESLNLVLLTHFIYI